MLSFNETYAQRAYYNRVVYLHCYQIATVLSEIEKVPSQPKNS